MTKRWALTLVGVLVLAASALAQMTADQKQEVLGEMDQVLTKEAFVPGVDLSKWRKFIDARREKLDAVESPREFSDIVNGALQEFGLSHIALIRERMRRGWGEPEAVQGRGRMSRVTAAWIDDDSALLRIPSFEGSYDPDEVQDLMDQMKDAKYLVIDLRGNPGGELERMRHFLGLVMPADTPVGTFVSRRMASEYERSKGSGSDPVVIAKWAHREFKPIESGEPFKGKIAVLVDNGSASASEIVANALHENRRSPIVGSQTAGAVLVSTFDRLSYGFQMQFPIGDYVSHGGQRLEGHPIVPDLSVRGSGAVEAALAKLKAKS